MLERKMRSKGSEHKLARMCRYILDYQSKYHPDTVTKGVVDSSASRSFSREGVTIDDFVGDNQKITVRCEGNEVFSFVFDKPGKVKGWSYGCSPGYWRTKVSMFYTMLEMRERMGQN